MADRYWVGGSGNINDTTHWSTTSGGSSGASVPTSSDNAIWDTNSHNANYTITVNVEFSCANFIIGNPSSGKPTLTVSNSVNVYGTTFTLASGMSISASYWVVYFKGSSNTQTITSNGVNLSAAYWRIVAYGTSNTVSLADNLKCGELYLYSGTFDTNDKNLEADNISIQGSPTLLLRSGSHSILYSLDASSYSSATITKGTSTVTIGTSGSVKLSNTTTQGLYNVVKTSSAYNNNSIGDSSGTMVVNNFTCNGSNSRGQKVSFHGNITINGTLTLNGYSTTNPLLLCSSVMGTRRTITSASNSFSNLAIADIEGAGAGSWDVTAITGLCHDMGNNSGITFLTGINCYWKHGANATYNFSDSNWYSETNGGGTSVRVPLTQDIVNFDSNSFNATGKTVTFNRTLIGAISFSGVTNSPTISSSDAIYIYGNATFSSNIGTFTISNGIYFIGRGSHQILSNGKSLPFIQVGDWDGFGGTYTLADDLTLTGATLKISINFNTNNYNMDISDIDFIGQYKNYSVDLGTSTIICRQSVGGTRLVGGYFANGRLTLTTNHTFKIIRDISTGLYADLTIGNDSSTFNIGNVWIATTGTESTYGIKFYGVTVKDLKVDASRGFKIANSATLTCATFSPQGSAGNLVKIRNTSSTTQATIAKAGGGKIDVDYIDIDYIIGSPSNTWYVGTHSTDGGHNTNVYFTAAPVIVNHFLSTLGVGK